MGETGACINAKGGTRREAEDTERWRRMGRARSVKRGWGRAQTQDASLHPLQLRGGRCSGVGLRCGEVKETVLIASVLNSRQRGRRRTEKGRAEV